MNFRGSIQNSAPGFQIAPMVDIVFLLLIFFLVTWNFSRNETELDVKVPKAREGKETSRAVGEVILNVKADGSVVMNRRAMDLAALGDALKKIAALYPDQAVILRGDENTDYRHVVEVLVCCSLRQLRCSLRTQSRCAAPFRRLQSIWKITLIQRGSIKCPLKSAVLSLFFLSKTSRRFRLPSLNRFLWQLQFR